MDKFGQISTELWSLIGIINWFFTLYLLHFFTNFLQTLNENAWFQNDFLCVENILWRGMLHACSAFIQNGTSLKGKSLLPKEFFSLRAVSYGMINHFYHIGCPPLNVTI